MKILQTVTHPMILIVLAAISALLWMPFGIGYYEWPWKNLSMRALIQGFAIGFVLLAIMGCVISARPQLSVGRLAVSVLSAIVALYCLFAMYHWMGRYVRPVLQNSTAQTSP
jgi:hypothetical protein